MERDRRSSKRN